MQTARITLLALVAISALMWVSHCHANESGLQLALDEILQEEGLTGVAWSLITETGGTSLGAAGLRDNLTRSAFTVNTRFHVGSVTKSLLATGVLRMATEGLIDLDTPVSLYLPEINFTDQWQAAELTVRHLLDHTSGLNDAQMWQMFSERPEPRTPLIEAFPRPETQLRIRSQPGSRFSYSNMGYTLLGMLVETVAGEPYEKYLDEHVLVPLDMLDSTFEFTTQEGADADPMLAWGHVDDGSRYAASPIFLRPAGQFTSTAADLARFASFLLSDGKIDGRPFIQQELMRSRGRPISTEAANNGLLAGYALGLGRRDRHGVVGYCHGGNIVGFVAMLCVFPDDHKAFAYSVNTDSESADYGRIDSLLIDALNVSKAEIPPSASPATDMGEWMGRYVLSPNRFQSFRYLDNVFGSIQVKADAGNLVITSLQQSPRQLRALGGRSYTADDRATASHVFLRGKNGEYLISDGFKTYEKVSSAWLGANWISVFLGLLGMIWLLLAGFTSVIRLRGKCLQESGTPAFVAIVLLFLPFPFFMTQSFMAIGDLTLASALLAAATTLLPLGMVLTIVRAGVKRKRSCLHRLNAWAAIFVLQWCVVLFLGGMLPLRLWV